MAPGAKAGDGGRRRAALASTEVTNETMDKARCESDHPLARFQTPYDNYSCSSCNRPFPWNTTLYCCRECDYDLCGRCINVMFADKKSTPKANTQAVADKVSARKEGIASPGSPMDLDSMKSEKKDPKNKASKDFYASLDEDPEERKLKQQLRRAEEEEAKAKREEFYAKREAEKARLAAERVEELAWSKVERQERKMVKEQLKQIEQERKADEAKKEKFNKEAEKMHKAREARGVKDNRGAAKIEAKADKAKAKMASGGKLPSSDKLSKLAAGELQDLLTEGGWTKNDEKKIRQALEVARKRTGKSDEKKAKGDAWQQQQEAKAKALQRELQAAEVARKKRAEEIEKKYAAERQARIDELNKLREEVGTDAAKDTEEIARAKHTKEEARQEVRAEKKQHKDIAHLSKVEAKAELKAMKDDKELAKAKEKGRKLEREKLEADRKAAEEEAMKKAQEDLQKGKGMNFNYLSQMGSWAISQIMGTDMLTEQEKKDALEEQKRAEAVEVREKAKLAAMEKGEKVLQKQIAKDDAAEKKRLAKIDKEETAAEKKLEADTKKYEAEEAKAQKKLEGAEKKRAANATKHIEKLKKQAEKNEKKREAEQLRVVKDAENKVTEEAAVLAVIEKDIKAGVLLTQEMLGLLSVKALKDLKAGTYGELKPNELELVDAAMDVAKMNEDMETAEWERRAKRFERERESEKEQLELAHDRATQAEKRAGEKKIRDEANRSFKDLQLKRRAREKKERDDKRAEKMEALKARNELQVKTFKELEKQATTEKKVDHDKLASLSAMQLGDLYAILVLPKSERTVISDQMMVAVERERVEAKDLADELTDERKRLKRVKARLMAENKAAAQMAQREERAEQRHAIAEEKEEKLHEKRLVAAERFAAAEADEEDTHIKEVTIIRDVEMKKKAFGEEQAERVKTETAARLEAHQAEVEAVEGKLKEKSDAAKTALEEVLANGKKAKTSMLNLMASADLEELINSGKLKEGDVLKAKSAKQVALAREREAKAYFKRKLDNAEASAFAWEKKLRAENDKKLDPPATKAKKVADVAADKKRKEEALYNMAVKSHEMAIRRVEAYARLKEKQLAESAALQEVLKKSMAEAKEMQAKEMADMQEMREQEKAADAAAIAEKWAKIKEVRERQEQDAANMLQCDLLLQAGKSLDFTLLPPMGSKNLTELLQSGIISLEEQKTVEAARDSSLAREKEEREYFDRVEAEEEEKIIKRRKEAEKARLAEEQRLQKDAREADRLEQKMAEAQRAEESAMEEMYLAEETATSARILADEAKLEADQEALVAAERKLAAREELREQEVQEKEKARATYEEFLAQYTADKETKAAEALDVVTNDFKLGKPLTEDYQMLVDMGAANLADLLEGEMAEKMTKGDISKLEKAKKEAIKKDEDEPKFLAKKAENVMVDATAKARVVERNERMAADAAFAKKDAVYNTLAEKAMRLEAKHKKASDKHAALVAKSEALKGRMGTRGQAQEAVAKLEQLASEGEPLDPELVQFVKDNKVQLGPEATVALAEEGDVKTLGKRLTKRITQQEKKQVKREKAYKEAKYKADKAEEEKKKGEADIKALKDKLAKHEEKMAADEATIKAGREAAAAEAASKAPEEPKKAEKAKSPKAEPKPKTPKETKPKTPKAEEPAPPAEAAEEAK